MHHLKMEAKHPAKTVRFLRDACLVPMCLGIVQLFHYFSGKQLTSLTTIAKFAYNATIFATVFAEESQISQAGLALISAYIFWSDMCPQTTIEIISGLAAVALFCFLVQGTIKTNTMFSKVLKKLSGAQDEVKVLESMLKVAEMTSPQTGIVVFKVDERDPAKLTLLKANSMSFKLTSSENEKDLVKVFQDY